MIDIDYYLKKNKAILVILPRERYDLHLKEIRSSLNKVYNKICYVSLNHPYNVISKKIIDEELDISNFFFIDVLTHTKEADNCIFIGAPNDLISINLAFTETMNMGFEVSIFDAISTLLIYVEPEETVKFVHNAVTKVREFDKHAVFILLKENIKEQEITEIQMFFDKVIDYTDVTYGWRK